MKTEVTFTPAKNPRLSDKTPFSPIKALQVSYGLVIHPAVDSGIRARRGYWDVSDPLTGALVAYGVYPGPEGAVAGLVEKAMSLKNRPAGFRGALERGRAKLRAASNS
ncbi:MAG: hypothetical protein HYU74_12520 [Dechloromonas sp.]|nr:hypothetical protein [Dechloromonas sp.]